MAVEDVGHRKSLMRKMLSRVPLTVKWRCSGVQVNVKGSLASDILTKWPKVSFTLWIKRGGLRLVLRDERRWVVRKRESKILCLCSQSPLGSFIAAGLVLSSRPSTLAIWRYPPQGEKRDFMQMWRARKSVKRQMQQGVKVELTVTRRGCGHHCSSKISLFNVVGK